MDPFLNSPLREWRLETTYDGGGSQSYKEESAGGCWQIVKCLGNGSSGTVWQERCISSPEQNSVRAVKQLRKQQSKFFEMSMRELEALTTFSDNHIIEYKKHFVQFLGWFDDFEHLYIAMEFLEYGDLQKFITAPFAEPEAVSIVTQVAQALQYMHQKSFVHRDIKPLNILVCSPGPDWHVKVADFGITKKTDGTALGTRGIGSHGYMAPELFGDLSDQYTASVDVWALGAVAFCLRTCNPPFPTIRDLLDYARDHRVGIPLHKLGRSSYFCVNFVLHTLAALPERRLTIAHVLTHGWLGGQPTSSGRSEWDMSKKAMSDTWTMSPSNAWSDTNDSADTQQSRVLSSTTPMTEPELNLPPLLDSSSRLGDLSADRLALNMKQLGVAQGRQAASGNMTRQPVAKPEDNPPDMLKAMASLSAKYLQQKNYDRAESTAEDVVNLRREIFGNSHSETINALADLADKEVLELRRDVLGHRHPDTIQSLANLAVVRRVQGKLDNAESAYKELFFLQRQVSPEKSSLAMESLEYISGIQYKQSGIDWGKASDQPNVKVKVVSADRLGAHTLPNLMPKIGMTPSPYVKTMVGSTEVHSTSIQEGTQHPTWNETIDIKAGPDTVIMFGVYDSKRSKKRNGGWLGEMGIHVGKHLNLEEGGYKFFKRYLTEITPTIPTERQLAVSLSTIRPGPRSQRFMQDGLPAGWEMYQTRSGRLYYLDYSTKSISVTRPKTGFPEP